MLRLYFFYNHIHSDNDDDDDGDEERIKKEQGARIATVAVKGRRGLQNPGV